MNVKARLAKAEAAIPPCAWCAPQVAGNEAQKRYLAAHGLPCFENARIGLVVTCPECGERWNFYDSTDVSDDEKRWWQRFFDDRMKVWRKYRGGVNGAAMAHAAMLSEPCEDAELQAERENLICTHGERMRAIYGEHLDNLEAAYWAAYVEKVKELSKRR